MKFYTDYFEDIGNQLRSVDVTMLDRLTTIFREAHDRKRKIILVGNGGSASIASHARST